MDAVKGANKRDQEGYGQKKAEQELAIVQVSLFCIRMIQFGGIWSSLSTGP